MYVNVFIITPRKIEDTIAHARSKTLPEFHALEKKKGDSRQPFIPTSQSLICRAFASSYIRRSLRLSCRFANPFRTSSTSSELIQKPLCRLVFCVCLIINTIEDIGTFAVNVTGVNDSIGTFDKFFCNGGLLGFPFCDLKFIAFRQNW